MRNLIVKNEFTENDLQAAFTEMPQREWDALVFEIKAHIEELELESVPTLASNHGTVSHVMGGIYYLRNLLEQIDNKRILIE